MQSYAVTYEAIFKKNTKIMVMFAKACENTVLQHISEHKPLKVLIQKTHQK